MIYTGIGSRSAPPQIITEAQNLATLFAKRGYTLRSGKAQGMDEAFQMGVQKYVWNLPPDTRPSDIEKYAEIYIPWGSFKNSNLVDQWDYTFPNYISRIKCEEIASEIHPNWDACKQGAKKLHARNVYQVLGKDLETPSDFVLYWARENPDTGEIQGGTRTAVMLARQCDLPCINMYFDDWEEKLREVIND